MLVLTTASRGQNQNTSDPHRVVQDAAAKATDAATDLAREAQARFTSEPWFWWNVALAGLSVLVLFAKDVIRPGSLVRPTKRGVDSHPWWVWLVCGAMVFAVQAVMGGVAVSLLGAEAGAEHSTRRAAIGAGAATLLAAVTGVVIARLVRMSAPASGMTIGGRDFVNGPVAAALAIPLVNVAGFGAAWLGTRFGSPPAAIDHPTLRKLVDHPGDPWAWTSIGVAVVLAPIVEEIVYRGFLQSALLRVFGNAWHAVLVTAGLFAAAHVPMGIGWHGLVSIFVLGVALGVAMEKTRSLGVPIVVHALFNGMNVVLALAL